MEYDNQLLERRLSELDRDLRSRLIRLESKLVRGFEELGVNTAKDEHWLDVDDEARVVYVNTLGRSMMVILQTMLDNGASHYGERYELVHAKQKVASILLIELE